MYDIAIIGAGWAGFNAAIRARDLGSKVALIDRGPLGGTCLNAGCIPTKTLLHCAKVYKLVLKASLFGTQVASAQFDFQAMLARKEKIILQLRRGMELQLSGIDYFPAKATIISPDRLKIGNENLSTKFIIVATGSRPLELGSLKFDGKKIISSDEALNLTQLPLSILIVGGGVIGCEFASLFSHLGVKVSVVEKMSQLLPGEDQQIAQKLEIIFKKKGIDVHTGLEAAALDLDKYEQILVCVGRLPQIEDMGLQQLDLRLDGQRIAVNDYLQTSIPNIYAAGDCTAKAMLAHFAAYQGGCAAQNICQPELRRKADNLNIPQCIFTDPEIASIGLTEDEARCSGIKVNTYIFDFLGSGLARILDETEGLIKVVADAESTQLLGASIIGPRATELISILNVGICAGLKIGQLQDKVIFPHPTLSEAIQEALKKSAL